LKPIGQYRRPAFGNAAMDARPDGRGTLRAFTPKALDQPSRRLTKYFDKVRVRRTGKALLGAGRIGGHNENQYLDRGAVGRAAAQQRSHRKQSRGDAGHSSMHPRESKTVDTPAHAGPRHATGHLIGMSVAYR